MKRLANLFMGLVFATVPILGGCGGSTLTWQEEVKLLDGRVITVTQKRRYESVYTGSNTGNLPREYWLAFKLPEFGDKEVIWHENARPLVLNIYQGTLYLVGTPPTGREFIQYGSPSPGYVQFKFMNDRWQRITFAEIPKAIYDGNLLISNEPQNSLKLVSLVAKAEEMKSDTISGFYKKLDPKWIID